MKKIIIIIVCIALLAGGGFFIYNKMGIGTEVSVELVLPQNPLFYTKIKDVDSELKRFAETSFWKNVSQIDIEKLFGDKLVGQERLIWEAVKVQFTDPTTNKLLSTFFGKEFAVAVYPIKIDVNQFAAFNEAAMLQIVSEMLSGIYIVTHLDPQAQIAEYISRTAKQIGDGVSIDKKEYKDHTINLLTFSDSPINLAYVRVDNFMVISVGLKSAQRSIDIYLKEQPSLAQDKQYLEAQQYHIKDATSLGFINARLFIDVLERQVNGMAQLNDPSMLQARKQIDDTFAMIKGFKSATFSSVWDNIVKSKLALMYDVAAMSPEASRFYKTCNSVENESINFVPRDTLAYQWNTCFDLSEHWAQTKKELQNIPAAEGAPSVEDQIRAYEGLLGLSIENDLIPAIGQEFGGFLHSVKMGGEFPIPQLALFIKIANKEKIMRLLGLLDNMPLIAIQTENYQGIDVKYLNIPVGVNLSPGYAFVGDYFLISVDQAVVKASVDAYKDKSQSLVASKNFKVINEGLTNKSIGVQYFYLAKIAAELIEVVDWSGTWFSAADEKKQAFKAGSELRLEEMKKSVMEYEEQLKNKEDQIALLEDEVWDLEAQSLDSSLKKEELNQLKEDIINIDGDIGDVYIQIEDLEYLIGGYDNPKVSNKARQMYIDEIIFPVLNGFKAIESFGSVSDNSQEALKTNIFMKMN